MTPAAPLPASLMRGGAHQALFLHQRDLPGLSRERDALIARLMGSPDPGGQQIDGLGAGRSASSRVVIVNPSLRDDCDVDALYGMVDCQSGRIDWEGGESELIAATGMFALLEGLHPCTEGVSRVRICHGGARSRIDALIPVRGGQVLQTGAFQEEGVPFGGVEIRLEFLDPTDGGRSGPLLPSGAVSDRLNVPGLGEIALTVLDGGWPAVILRAQSLGLSGRETGAQLERDRRLKTRLLAVQQAVAQRHSLGGQSGFAPLLGSRDPALIWVAPPAAYRSLSGGEVSASEIDLLARGSSQGRLLMSLPVGVTVAIAVAAALPGTLANEIARTLPGLPTRIGHIGGAAAVGADLVHRDQGWLVEKVVVSHGARRLMRGWAER